MSIRRLLIPLACSLALLGTARRTAANDVETSGEKAIGNVVVRLLTSADGVDEDPLLANWVSGIGTKVGAESPRKDLPPKFLIVGSDVSNALTLPGGTVLVTRGLLDSVESDDELASVLAHETAHVAKKHAVRLIEGTLIFDVLETAMRQSGYSNAAKATSVYNIFRTLNKSREQEQEADDFGLEYAYEAGYDPGGLVQFLDGFTGGKSNIIEKVLATHPSPEKRIAEARQSPLLIKADPAIREKIASDYTSRGYPGLAESVRRGSDPFQWPPLPQSPLTPEVGNDRNYLVTQAQNSRRALLSSYHAREVGDTLQQILLINSNFGDLRWDYLAARAYAIQGRIDNLYSRTLRTLRVAPGIYDRLAVYASRPGSDPSVANAAQGRAELQEAVAHASAATRPLQHASDAVAAALVDLNNHYLRPRGNSEPWLRFAADEGTLRYAESELARVDKYSGQSWRLLSLAQIRAYEARLSDLAPVDDAPRRALWSRLAADRFGAKVDDGSGLPTGAATVRAALAIELEKTPDDIEAGRGATPWADWVTAKKGTPENIATAMRLLTLDMERETSAEDRYGIGSR